MVTRNGGDVGWKAGEPAPGLPEEVVRLILDEVEGDAGVGEVASKYGVSAEAIVAWQKEARHSGAGVETGQVPTVSPSRTTGRYSRAFKEEVVKQVDAGRKALEVARQYGLPETTVYRWRKKTAEAGGTVPEAKSTRPLSTDASPISEEHRSLVLELKGKHPSMGPAQIQSHLRRFYALKLSRQMIGRIFTQAGIPLQKRSPADGDPAQNRFEMSRPNELWAVDFKEFWIHAEKVYALFLLDDYSRFCVGFALTQTPTADLAIETVNAAIQRYGRPERILSDRGPQFHAWNGVSRFDVFLGDFLVDHTVTKAGHCFTNGKIEAFNRSLEVELLDVVEFASMREAEEAIRRHVQEYNFLRTHMGIGDLVPADRYFGMVEEAQRALEEGLRKAGPGLSWLRGLVSHDGPAVRPPAVLQLVLRDGKLELLVLGRRFTLG